MSEYTPEIGDRIAALLNLFKLSSAADQMTKRFVEAGFDQALVTLAEVLEVEAHTRRERRVDRLRRASRLPPAKTFDTLDPTHVPRTVLIQARELARGHFVERADPTLKRRGSLRHIRRAGSADFDRLPVDERRKS